MATLASPEPRGRLRRHSSLLSRRRITRGDARLRGILRKVGDYNLTAGGEIEIEWVPLQSGRDFTLASATFADVATPCVRTAARRALAVGSRGSLPGSVSAIPARREARVHRLARSRRVNDHAGAVDDSARRRQELAAMDAACASGDKRRDVRDRPGFQRAFAALVSRALGARERHQNASGFVPWVEALWDSPCRVMNFATCEHSHVKGGALQVRISQHAKRQLPS
jgi:hypothetical protein